MARKKRNQFDVDEIYRGLRTNIEFSQMDDAIQVINVVSTISNEGKSTIACNLARIMAAKYKNVLLIDCDLRNASVHKTLQISNRSGLTNIIAEFKEGVSIHHMTVHYSLLLLKTNLHPKNLRSVKTPMSSFLSF